MKAKTEQFASALYNQLMHNEKEFSQFIDAVDDEQQNPDGSFTIRCTQFDEESFQDYTRPVKRELVYTITIKAEVKNFEDE